MSNVMLPLDAAGLGLQVGDCRRLLRALPEGSVQAVVTSPPYWNLRNYSTTPQTWGGTEDCTHEWDDVIVRDRHGDDRRGATSTIQGSTTRQAQTRGDRRSAFCSKCGCWRGELGAEPTPDLFMAHLVEVFREVRRVLRDDGVLWLNLGDCFATKGDRRSANKGNLARDGVRRRDFQTGLKNKDLLGLPWQVAFALRGDGWSLRAGIPWLKRNAMTESVADRPAVSHEYVFLLTKTASPFYDVQATKLPDKGKHSGVGYNRPERLRVNAGQDQEWLPGGGRNRRTTDWFFDSLRAILDGGEGLLHDPWGTPLALVVNLRSHKGAHFAVFPERLIEPLILAGTSEKGCCPSCGAPWRRLVKKERVPTRPGTASKVFGGPNGRMSVSRDPNHPTELDGKKVGNRDPLRHVTRVETVGWEPSCKCPEAEPVPCLVLDPFVGSGTTLAVCRRLGRRCLGLELNEEHAEFARARVGLDIPLFARAAS